jgi:hypothetical protein
LALDGKLLDNEDVNVDFFKIARDLINNHKHGVDGLLSETEIERKITELMYKNVAQVVVEDIIESPKLLNSLTGETKPVPLKRLTGETKSIKRIVSRNQVDLFV